MSAVPEPHRPLPPVRKAWRFLRVLAQPGLARKLGTLVTEGYLERSGWVRSVREGGVVAADGSALPWTTLSYIDFITPRLKPEWTVFEYGAGASTRFYAARVAMVLAVEHDEAFAKTLTPQLPQNARLLVRPEGAESYINAAAECQSRPDLVSVDGRDRVRCVQAALTALAPSGVLVLDDAERPEYGPAWTALKAAGFRAVEFWGLAPGGVERKCTAVFYRDGNGLGL